MFDLNRNQLFLAGLLFLFLGLQLRAVESYKLTPELTQFLAERTGHPLASVNAATPALTQSGRPLAQKTIRPADWIGWAMLSLSATLILQSLIMRRPDGK
ncbi:MAG: hypothetical protein RBS80_19070 [Thermoguttaceae bacterium]|jgi:hypothetical protein|nr:hypothetical protein [Thermoguttaceae bacterium]